MKVQKALANWPEVIQLQNIVYSTLILCATMGPQTMCVMHNYDEGVTNMTLYLQYLVLHKNRPHNVQF